jgi:hypothetical protein
MRYKIFLLLPCVLLIGCATTETQPQLSFEQAVFLGRVGAASDGCSSVGQDAARYGELRESVHAVLSRAFVSTEAFSTGWNEVAQGMANESEAELIKSCREGVESVTQIVSQLSSISLGSQNQARTTNFFVGLGEAMSAVGDGYQSTAPAAYVAPIQHPSGQVNFGLPQQSQPYFIQTNTPSGLKQNRCYDHGNGNVTCN